MLQVDDDFKEYEKKFQLQKIEGHKIHVQHQNSIFFFTCNDEFQRFQLNILHLSI